MNYRDRFLFMKFNLLHYFNETQYEEYINWVINRVIDETLCNNSCEDTYFCDLKKNHKGPHQESGFSW